MKKIAAFAFAFLLTASLRSVTPEDLALAKSLRGVYRTMPDDNPARYAVDLISTQYWHSIALGRVSGEIPATEEQLSASRASLREIRSKLDMGLAWQAKPPKLTIPRLAKAPSIDGEFAPREWADAFRFDTMYPIDSTVPAASVCQWYVAYDESCLYAAACFPERPKAVYGYNDPCGKQPWDGDAAEVFILPDPRLLCYRESVFTPAGCALFTLHTKRMNEIHINCRPESPEKIRCASRTDGDGWTIEIAIPFSELPGYFRGNPPRSGEELRFALIRTRDGRQFSVFPLLYGGHNIYGYAKGILE